MIKVVCTHGVPPWPALWRFCCHADLDRLARPAGLGRDGFSRIMQDLWLDGVWRWSRAGRLPRSDRLLADHLAARRLPRYDLLDLGASDGTTTLDLLHTLRQRLAAPVTIRLTDRFLALHRFRSGRLVEYRTPDGLPLLLRWHRLALRLPRSEHRWNLLGHFLARRWLACTTWRSSMSLDAELPLVQPAARASRDILIRPLDCLRLDPALTASVDALRAANLLNLSYFTGHQLRRAVACCHAYLKPDGLFLVVRCEGPRHREVECASLWRKTPAGFTPLAQLGPGSEIAPLVDRFQP